MFSICDKFCFEVVFLGIKSWHIALIYWEKRLPAGTQYYIWEYLPLKNSKRRQWSSSRPRYEQGCLTLAFAGDEEVVCNVTVPAGMNQTRSCPALLWLYTMAINHIDPGVMSPKRWFVPNVCSDVQTAACRSELLAGFLLKCGFGRRGKRPLLLLIEFNRSQDVSVLLLSQKCESTVENRWGFFCFVFFYKKKIYFSLGNSNCNWNEPR